MADPAYARRLRDGNLVDELTHQALLAAEEKLGYELTIVQGSYNKGVAASAGTHDGGGVVDLAPWDQANKVRVLREVGFAAWYRPAVPDLWGPHIHAVLIGNNLLSPAAARQVDAYYAGRDGLKSNLPDPTPRPDPIPIFTWHPPTRGWDVDRAIRHAQKAARKAKSRRRLRRFRLLRSALDTLRKIKAN